MGHRHGDLHLMRTPPRSIWGDVSFHDREWHSARLDLLPLIRRGVAAMQAKGQFVHTMPGGSGSLTGHELRVGTSPALSTPDCKSANPSIRIVEQPDPTAARFPQLERRVVRNAAYLGQIRLPLRDRTTYRNGPTGNRKLCRIPAIRIAGRNCRRSTCEARRSERPERLHCATVPAGAADRAWPSGYRSPIGGKNGDQACSSRQQSSPFASDAGTWRAPDDPAATITVPFRAVGRRPRAARSGTRKRKDRPPHATDGAATTGGSPSRVRRWVAAFRERPFRHACNPACGVYVRYRDGLSPGTGGDACSPAGHPDRPRMERPQMRPCGTAMRRVRPEIRP